MRKKIIDYLISKNCKKDLGKEVAKNTAICAGTLLLLKENKNKLLYEVSTPARSRRTPLACR
jgi:hypothetical protein